jgi:hypothetical protein
MEKGLLQDDFVSRQTLTGGTAGADLTEGPWRGNQRYRNA